MLSWVTEETEFILQSLTHKRNYSTGARRKCGASIYVLVGLRSATIWMSGVDMYRGRIERECAVNARWGDSSPGESVSVAIRFVGCETAHADGERAAIREWWCQCDPALRGRADVKGLLKRQM